MLSLSKWLQSWLFQPSLNDPLLLSTIATYCEKRGGKCAQEEFKTEKARPLSFPSPNLNLGWWVAPLPSSPLLSLLLRLRSDEWMKLLTVLLLWMQKATLGGRERKLWSGGRTDGGRNGGDGKCKERRRERTVLINARLFSRAKRRSWRHSSFKWWLSPRIEMGRVWFLAWDDAHDWNSFEQKMSSYVVFGLDFH